MLHVYVSKVTHSSPDYSVPFLIVLCRQSKTMKLEDVEAYGTEPGEGSLLEVSEITLA